MPTAAMTGSGLQRTASGSPEPFDRSRRQSEKMRVSHIDNRLTTGSDVMITPRS
jgi:hypothetical protein